MWCYHGDHMLHVGAFLIGTCGGMFVTPSAKIGIRLLFAEMVTLRNILRRMLLREVSEKTFTCPKWENLNGYGELYLPSKYMRFKT